MNQPIEVLPVDPLAANRQLVELTATQRIRWAVDQFGEHAVVLASMQKTSSVLLHLLGAMQLRNEVLFVDTGFHFAETLAVRDALASRYDLNVVSLHPELTPAQQREKFGFELYNYVDGQPDCCQMRKETPFLMHMRSRRHRLVMLGLRREEGGARRNLKPLELDPRYGGYALHPLVDWSAMDIEAYLLEHDVPVNALHARGYPSIGCSVCTTPVAPGEDERAGRWRHLRGNGGQPQYCGINFSDGGGI